MTTEICMHCDKKFELNDGFDNERMITCVKCLKRHFELTKWIYEKLIVEKEEVK